jgi:hypothetical protein
MTLALAASGTSLPTLRPKPWAPAMKRGECCPGYWNLLLAISAGTTLHLHAQGDRSK